MNSRFCSVLCHLCGIVIVMVVASPVLGGIENWGAWADRDNSIFEEGSLSNGAGEHLFSGNTGFGTARRALLHFDVAEIPPGTTITAVGITMYCTKSPDAIPRTFGLHRVTADWGAAGSDAGDPGGTGAPAQTGDATWTERFFGQSMPWAAPGGDYVTGASATAFVGVCNEASATQVVFFSTPELVADIQAWVDDPGSNFGWILIGDEVNTTTARRFSSSDHNHLPQQPRLDLVFEIDDVPAVSTSGAALLVLLIAAASALELRRRSRRTH